MPARDIYYDVVKKALIKEGWKITHDPFHMSYGGFDFYIDLGAEALIAAEKNGLDIAVEIKSFLSHSSLSDFHVAVGQFINYRLVLTQNDPDRILYLAVSDFTFDNFFTSQFGQLAIKSNQLKLIIFDEKEEVISQWLE